MDERTFAGTVSAVLFVLFGAASLWVFRGDPTMALAAALTAVVLALACYWHARVAYRRDTARK